MGVNWNFKTRLIEINNSPFVDPILGSLLCLHRARRYQRYDTLSVELRGTVCFMIERIDRRQTQLWSKRHSGSCSIRLGHSTVCPLFTMARTSRPFSTTRPPWKHMQRDCATNLQAISSLDSMRAQPQQKTTRYQKQAH